MTLTFKLDVDTVTPKVYNFVLKRYYPHTHTHTHTTHTDPTVCFTWATKVLRKKFSTLAFALHQLARIGPAYLVFSTLVLRRNHPDRRRYHTHTHTIPSQWTCNTKLPSHTEHGRSRSTGASLSTMNWSCRFDLADVAT